VKALDTGSGSLPDAMAAVGAFVEAHFGGVKPAVKKGLLGKMSDAVKAILSDSMPVAKAAPVVRAVLPPCVCALGVCSAAFVCAVVLCWASLVFAMCWACGGVRCAVFTFGLVVVVRCLCSAGCVCGSCAFL
jgi:hypothetical protein